MPVKSIARGGAIVSVGVHTQACLGPNRDAAGSPAEMRYVTLVRTTLRERADQPLRDQVRGGVRRQDRPRRSRPRDNPRRHYRVDEERGFATPDPPIERFVEPTRRRLAEHRALSPTPYRYGSQVPCAYRTAIWFRHDVTLSVSNYLHGMHVVRNGTQPVENDVATTVHAFVACVGDRHRGPGMWRLAESATLRRSVTPARGRGPLVPRPTSRPRRRRAAEPSRRPRAVNAATSRSLPSSACDEPRRCTGRRHPDKASRRDAAAERGQLRLRRRDQPSAWPCATPPPSRSRAGGPGDVRRAAGRHVRLGPGSRRRPAHGVIARRHRWPAAPGRPDPHRRTLRRGLKRSRQVASPAPKTRSLGRVSRRHEACGARPRIDLTIKSLRRAEAVTP